MEVKIVNNDVTKSLAILPQPDRQARRGAAMRGESKISRLICSAS